MSTSDQIARINKLQDALSALALLNLNGFMFSDDAKISDGDTYDYIVVGGGSSGAVVAARLVEANYSTLIIEAGGNSGLENKFPGLVTYIKNSRMDWNYSSVNEGITGQCHKASGSLLGKVLGGSGVTNFMIYGRGNPRDYEKFYKATNDSSWKWKNMLKYFKRTENLQDSGVLSSAFGRYHGTKGRIGVTKENRSICDNYLIGFSRAGQFVVHDNVGAGILGYSSALYYIVEGIRTDGASAYLSPLKNNTKLQIIRNSLVTKIIFDENKNAVGVEFVDNCNTTITVKARKEVIVSAGPTKSPQLLMLSGIGPKEELESMGINVLSNIPVGKNLQNVVGAFLVFRTNRKAKPKPFNAHLFPAPLIVGYSTINESNCYPDYETLNFIIDDAEYFQAFCGFTLAFQNSICDRLLMLANNTQMMVTVLSNIEPESRGEIKLNSTNPFDQPKIISGYYTNDPDLKKLVEYIIDYVKIEKAPHFIHLNLEVMEATEKCNEFEFGSREYWRCYALCMFATTGRNCCTCSMGSVVDSKLNVIGVKRLRVVDASVMPNTIGTTIYASVVALAEKAADMIIESSKN